MPPSSPYLVVVGASAGGVEALKELLTLLPADLPAAVCATLHLASGTRSMLADVLRRRSALPVRAAADDEELEPGTVYIAQPDSHLVVVDGRLVVARGARENGYRPSVDVLLRSAALAHGPKVVGVVLTGMLDDGTAGLAAVARYGGTALVQDPDEAEFSSMPRNALSGTPGAVALGLRALAEEVVRIVTSDDSGAPAAPEVDPERRQRDEAEVRSALGVDPSLPDGSPVGTPSPYGCPDCGGVLNLVPDDVLRFRCRVGHAHTAESLMREQSGTVEAALWTAMRALEERHDVAERLADEAAAAGRDWSRLHFRRRAEEAARSSEVLRVVLSEHRSVAEGDEDPSRVLGGGTGHP